MDRLEAARRAAAYFGIDDEGVLYKYNMYRRAHPGVMLQNGDLLLGAGAFYSWSRLGAVLGREIEVHWQRQVVGRGWKISSRTLNAGGWV